MMASSELLGARGKPRAAAESASAGARANGALPLAPAAGRAIIRKHSKSFALASLLLGPSAQTDAVGLYAYCRRADDAVDLVPPGEALGQVALLRRELDAVYGGEAVREPILSEFQRVVFERSVPRAYPEALLEGFLLDAQGAEYATMAELERYCWCVAGSVGAMMCHVLGVRRERAVLHGVHLGMAMQLTNICRDVAEDWGRGRLYLPAEVLERADLRPGAGLPPQPARAALTKAVKRLLGEAEQLYRSGDLGLPYLSFRSRVAVATARRVYSAIGARLLATGADVTAGRAVVPTAQKLWSVSWAGIDAVRIESTAPTFNAVSLRHVLRFPEDVIRR